MIPVIVVVLVIYFAAMVVIGFMGRDKASNFEGYLSMSRTGGVLLLMGGAIGGQIGNGFVVGGAEQGAAVGMAGAAYGIACALTLILVALCLNNFIYNNNYLSLADYTKKRYHNDIPGTIYDLSTAVSSIGLMAGQIMALASRMAAPATSSGGARKMTASFSLSNILYRMPAPPASTVRNSMTHIKAELSRIQRAYR